MIEFENTKKLRLFIDFFYFLQSNKLFQIW
jgi:hypothetical protein